ncbi:hypothetical protein DYB25_010476 [Aphanomyces astaci]|uniref:Uncharacterized protein n=1 Tax=Aphanomyces astaci TaxID=112090 RepID=A0A396ZWM9_APHAT|nr:hypothetical protein DYB25_010476 [Aphanomyces astaci]RHY82120.1 hypothetical protein DYB31_011909 [Aphanomyces astaci]RHZ12585.1 hypothetical protein DYB26_007846 [Aphanomyces astaci]
MKGSGNPRRRASSGISVLPKRNMNRQSASVWELKSNRPAGMVMARRRQRSVDTFALICWSGRCPPWPPTTKK